MYVHFGMSQSQLLSQRLTVQTISAKKIEFTRDLNGAEKNSQYDNCAAHLFGCLFIIFANSNL